MDTEARDLRLDLLRGIALFVVLLDHIEDHTFLKVFSRLSPVSICFFDGAELFVFISGLTYGRVFGRHMSQDGFRSCQFKSIKRASEIYLTYLSVTCLAIGIGVGFKEFAPSLTSILTLQSGAFNCLAWSVPMCYQPWGTSILAVYVFALPFMPLLLFWRLRSPLTAWLVSLGLYLATQSISELQLPRYPWGRAWFFNPLAWQLLFFLGMCVGTNVLKRLRPALNCIPTIIGMTALFLFGIFIRTCPVFEDVSYQYFCIDKMEFVKRWGDKTQCGPIRLAHFMSFVSILSVALPGASSNVWRHVLLAPVVVCGQNSLAVFSFGLILMLLSVPTIVLVGESSLTLMLIEWDCCLLSIGCAYSAKYYKQYCW